MQRAAERWGGDNVMVSSFTRAAAAEIVSRLQGIDIPKRQVGTLHSICYHAFGQPEIAELHKNDFNEAFPTMKISGGAFDPDDPLAQAQDSVAKHGDRMLQRMSLNRTRMLPREVWSDEVLVFAAAWDDFKRQTEMMDFTDLLEKGLSDLDHAPGLPQVGVTDEAQDLSRLQFEITRKWAQHMEYCVFYGDDDQSIYTFSGADPEHLIDNAIPQDQKRVLAQSYRLPRAVYEHASNWIDQCSSRYDKQWSPVSGREGEVIRFPGASSRAPGALVDEIERRTDRGESIMVLASCSFMLAPTIAEMRERGLVFHNPYRSNRGDWNPWNTSTGSTVGRVRSFLRHDVGGLGHEWTYADFNNWVGLIQAKGALTHGAKKRIQERAKESPTLKCDPAFLLENLGQGPWEAWEHPWSDHGRLLEWLADNAIGSRAKHMKYVAHALTKDPDLLSPHRKPRITVGTIHSVKGGEADTTILFPDISREAAISWQRIGPHRDSVIRTFYVGMTRPRNSLIIPNNSDPLYVRI